MLLDLSTALQRLRGLQAVHWQHKVMLSMVLGCCKVWKVPGRHWGNSRHRNCSSLDVFAVAKAHVFLYSAFYQMLFLLSLGLATKGSSQVFAKFKSIAKKKRGALRGSSNLPVLLS